MKKSRPAVQLKVLCHYDQQEQIEQLLLKETTSLGLRYYPVTKSMLERKLTTIQEGIYSGKSIKFKAEYEDCIKAARKYNVRLQDVYSEVEQCMKKLKK